VIVGPEIVVWGKLEWVEGEELVVVAVEVVGRTFEEELEVAHWDQDQDQNHLQAFEDAHGVGHWVPGGDFGPCIERALAWFAFGIVELDGVMGQAEQNPRLVGFAYLIGMEASGLLVEFFQDLEGGGNLLVRWCCSTLLEAD